MKKEKKQLTERQKERRRKAKQTLIDMIAPTAFLAFIALMVFICIKFQAQEVEYTKVVPNAYLGDDQAIVMDNGGDLVFTMDPLTTVFTVTQKSTGMVWSSVAENVESDTLALAKDKGMLQSNVILTYSGSTGLEVALDSYTYSIQNGIYDIETGDDYVRVNYSIGNIEKEYVIPPVITEENFKKWTDQMELAKKNLCSEYYKKYDINKLGKKDNKEELLANYPIIETEVIYVLRSNTKEQLKKTLVQYFEEVGYTYEDYEADKALNFAESVSDKPVFNLSLIFKWDGDDLVVELPFDSIELREDKPVYKINLLPYFGAGGKTDEGYMLVPEGGGALINFNNGKVSQSTYASNMYGWDMALSRDAIVHNTRAYYNVYGVSRTDLGSSFICIMEEGVSYATIKADISGKSNSYNNVGPEYTLYSRERYDVGEIANAAVFVYLEDLPDDEKIVNRYRFVSTSDYTDMALSYQDYLVNKYPGYFEKNNDSEAPVAVTVVGAVDKVKQILGVPTSRPLELTTFKEAAEMITDMTGAGLNNLSIKLTGWCNGGVQQKILKTITPVMALGSKSDLKSLEAVAENNNVDLYLDGYTQYEFDSNLFNGFFSFRDAAKTLSRERVDLHEYSHVTYAEREATDPYYLLHPELAFKMADNLVKYTSSLGTGVSFEDMGMELSSDFYRKNYVSREQNLNSQVELFKGLADNGQNVMINMGNDYAMPYVDMITEMDLKGSDYTILDADVPFYQIALHGYVNYAGESINVCGKEEQQLLESAEYGAGLAFTLMDESSFTLQNTLYVEYYGSDYSQWRDRMIDIYTRYNKEMGHVFNQKMVKHEIISSELTCTTYEDGTKVYVNYGYTDDLTAPDGTVVPSRDYKVVR